MFNLELIEAFIVVRLEREIVSTRDFMLAVKSIAAIRDVIGSNDQTLFEDLFKFAEKELREEFDAFDRTDEDDLNDFRQQLEGAKAELGRMLLTNPPPEKEPGLWITFIERIIKKKGLAVKVNLDFDQGYKHSYVWGPYRKLVQSRLSPAAVEALEHLDNGRPLRGKRVVNDGCLFSWLTLSEITALHDSLSQITATDVGDPELEEFHQDLVDALATLKKKKCDLILGAQ